MYPPVRLRKTRPDGSVRISWYGYRLADYGGFARLFAPRRTPRLHAGGSWAPDGVSIAAIDPSRPYVVHWWKDDEQVGFYVDTARSIQIADDVITYVDLFLDLSFHDGRWKVLDEEELALASPEDADAATRARGEVETLIRRDDEIFRFDGKLWAIPGDALELMPRSVDRLV